MKNILEELYIKDKNEIFNTRYHLLEKLLNRSDDQAFVQDAVIVNKIIAGNRFYQIIMEYKHQNMMVMNQSIYNNLIDQIYSHDQFWSYFDYGRAEELLRYMLELCSIDIRNINRIITVKNTLHIDNDEKKTEYDIAYSSYLSGNYREALEMLSTLFNNGVHNAAGILGILYFKGLGTIKDYNKALYYLSYPQIRDKRLMDEEVEALHELIDLKYKTKVNSYNCLIITLLVAAFIVLSGFINTNMTCTIIYLIIMSLGCVLFIFTYLKKYIFDFSLWYLIMGCMFLSMLVM